MAAEIPLVTTNRSAGRTAALLARQVERAIADIDLTLPQYRVLGILDEGSAMPTALAQRLALRPPSVTAVIDGLASRGLVERRPVADDRRQVSLVLTEKGRAILDRADVAADQRLAAIAGHLDVADGTRVLDDLGRWREALRAYYLDKIGAR